MQVSHIWNKLNLFSPKVILLFALVILYTGQTHAQKYKWARTNNPNYDNRKISYGFLIGLHTSTLNIKYSDQFVTQDFDTVYAVRPIWSSGFSLGFIVNYKAAEYLDIRLTPKVSFYEFKVRYEYTNATPKDVLIENTMVEFPVLAKYKSARRGNIRMYMIGGVSPGIEASGKKDFESTSLELKNFNLSIEGGFGFDLYYPLFKFSPEIRFSRGLLNIQGDTENIFGQPLKSISTNTVTVYLLFQ
jgi:hypothetical protein